MMNGERKINGITMHARMLFRIYDFCVVLLQDISTTFQKIAADGNHV